MKSLKKSLILALSVSAMAVNAHASIAEKKATRSADEAIAEAVAQTKSTCGNENLDVQISWDAVKEMTTKNAELIEQKNSKPEYVISEMSNRTTATLEALRVICAEDEDYKEEIAKLTTVQVTPKSSYDDYDSEFSLDGTTLSVKNGFYMSRSASDFTRQLKALY